jgi:hypothetical protein
MQLIYITVTWVHYFCVLCALSFLAINLIVTYFLYKFYKGNV